MAVSVTMPQPGENVKTVVLTHWFKKPGEKVKKGKPLFAYEVNKVDQEYKAPCRGLVLAIFFEAEDEVPCGTSVAVIGKKGEDIAGFKPVTATVDYKVV